MTHLPKQPALPKVSPSALVGHLGETEVDRVVTKMGFIFRRQSVHDYGVDGIIEITEPQGATNRVATGRQIAVQSKSGDTVVRHTRRGYTLYCTEAMANYWLGHSLPVIVVHSRPKSGRLFWEHVTPDSLRSTPKGFAIDINDTSDLAQASEELRRLATAGKTDTLARPEAVLLLPFDENTGILIPDNDLGISCLELAKAAGRGDARSIEIEVVGQAELIASIESLRDGPAPTAEMRREALIRDDILERYERKARELKRGLTWFLTSSNLSRFIGWNDEWLARAVRQFARYFVLGSASESGSVPLVAWPAVGQHQPTVRFDLNEEECEYLYGGNNMTRALIRLGDAGGVITFELGDEVFLTRFMPALVRHLMLFADRTNVPDERVFDTINVEYDQWMLGLA